MLPELEAERIAALCSVGVLDTSDDQHLNRIVRTCRQILDVPVAYVSLVDEERQWFKSIEGLDLRETKREDSFCTITIEHDRVFEVPDATKHELFRSNPYVTGPPNIRYYLGAPVTVLEHRIGTLCVLDFEPREPASESKKEILVELATIVAREILIQHLVRGSIPFLVDAVAGPNQSNEIKSS